MRHQLLNGPKSIPSGPILGSPTSLLKGREEESSLGDTPTQSLRRKAPDFQAGNSGACFTVAFFLPDC